MPSVTEEIQNWTDRVATVLNLKIVSRIAYWSDSTHVTETKPNIIALQIRQIV